MIFQHPALDQTNDKPLVYTAMSKHRFYFREHISKFVIEHGGVPLNPFMIFSYFLLDSVDRDLVRNGNNVIVKRADELWVFGEVSNGVLAEILLAKKLHKPITYFGIKKPHEIVRINKEEVVMEADVEQFRSKL